MFFFEPGTGVASGPRRSWLRRAAGRRSPGPRASRAPGPRGELRGHLPGPAAERSDLGADLPVGGSILSSFWKKKRRRPAVAGRLVGGADLEVERLRGVAVQEVGGERLAEGLDGRLGVPHAPRGRARPSRSSRPPSSGCSPSRPSRTPRWRRRGAPSPGRRCRGRSGCRESSLPTVCSTPFLNWLKTSSTENWKSSPSPSGASTPPAPPSSSARSRAMSKLSSARRPARSASASTRASAAAALPFSRRSSSASFALTPGVVRVELGEPRQLLPRVVEQPLLDEEVGLLEIVGEVELVLLGAGGGGGGATCRRGAAGRAAGRRRGCGASPEPAAPRGRRSPGGAWRRARAGGPGAGAGAWRTGGRREGGARPAARGRAGGGSRRHLLDDSSSSNARGGGVQPRGRAPRRAATRAPGPAPTASSSTVSVSSSSTTSSPSAPATASARSSSPGDLHGRVGRERQLLDVRRVERHLVGPLAADQLRERVDLRGSRARSGGAGAARRGRARPRHRAWRLRTSRAPAAAAESASPAARWTSRACSSASAFSGSMREDLLQVLERLRVQAVLDVDLHLREQLGHVPRAGGGRGLGHRAGSRRSERPGGGGRPAGARPAGGRHLAAAPAAGGRWPPRRGAAGAAGPPPIAAFASGSSGRQLLDLPPDRPGLVRLPLLLVDVRQLLVDGDGLARLPEVAEGLGEQRQRLDVLGVGLEAELELGRAPAWCRPSPGRRAPGRGRAARRRGAAPRSAPRPSPTRRAGCGP